MFFKIHHPALYLIGIISLIAWGINIRINESEYEMKFYQKWHIARQRKLWVRMSYAALDGFIYTVLMLLFRFAATGFPSAQLLKTHPERLKVPILLILIISLAVGAVEYRSKEKKYHDINNKINKNKL
jgi:hypothetical protein